MKITITLQKDADPAPRYANVEIDEALLDLMGKKEPQAIAQEIAPYIEAMLALEPAD